MGGKFLGKIQTFRVGFGGYDSRLTPRLEPQ